MIPLVKPFVPPREALLPQLEATLYSGYIAEGVRVREFEAAFSRYLGAPYVLSTSSGTAALHLALQLAGVQAGDEVISTALTAEPTNVAILQAGAKVVWGDVDYRTGTLSPDDVRAKISKKTKAIMLVHYAGIVADLASFGRIAEEYAIPIIEDAAHALGAKYRDKRIGSVSSYTIFSFQAIKHITTVDGGVLTVGSHAEHDRGRIKRWFGLDKTKPRLEGNITELGYKYHMNDVTATIGLVQMQFVEDVVGRYVANGRAFDAALANTPGVELIRYYPETQPSYWLYTLKVENRASFVRMLADRGVTASELHLRNDRHAVFGGPARLPELDRFYEKMVHIPCGWWVTREDRERIIEAIAGGW